MSNLQMKIRVALDSFDLEIDLQTSARVVGLFGPSGSGKTTLLETLAGLERRATGVIKFNDNTWLDSSSGTYKPAHERTIGYVPQSHQLFPHWSVTQNLRAGQKRAYASGQDTSTIFETTVEVLELGSLLERGIEHLSGGERQRVALGRALCSAPQLLLLDEPMAALDAGLRTRILPLLRRIKETFGIPIVIVSHQPAELLAICDEVHAIRDGKIESSGTPVELFSRPEIYPLAQASGTFDNSFPAIVTEPDIQYGNVQLGLDGKGPSLAVAGLTASPGNKVYLRIGAQEIILSREPVAGISARNVIPGKVTRLATLEAFDLVTLELDGLPGHPLLVEITDVSVKELDLQAGVAVWTIFKTTSIRSEG